MSIDSPATGPLPGDQFSSDPRPEAIADARPKRRRERDLAGWIITPIATIVVAPPLVLILAVIILTGDQSPAMCHDVATANGCEELTLGMIGQHMVIFLALWLALWAMPWWRSLRPWRIAVAVIAALVLLALPIRMAGDDAGTDEQQPATTTYSTN